MDDERPDLAELELAELESVVTTLGADRFHARQIFRWLHRRGRERFDGMTDLSRHLRARLDETCT
ncbi:MAG: bifunctional tRNA (adenosine(37)-C2)-methyltransferase TrmG/ribosomal RNA large subunit methyltransferase RlmN, partial [bacterium]